ncbi:MAG TPA: sulfite exporter TauE/SafE family protein [Polyangia bacterium]|nr:sulfite exporter TauE/SafE family protein [Polyangia bacterium]
MLSGGFEPLRFALAALAGLLTGVAKTGVPGFGILAVPLMVLAVGDARHAAGWLLPLLCLADLFAIATYRRHADARRLFDLLPWVLGGIAIGFVTLAAPERRLRLLVAAIVIVMIGLRLRARRASADQAAAPARDRWWQAAGYGVSAGFATTVANAAGPVMNLYLLARRLPKQEFVATGAWFFFVVNLLKLPIYGWHGLIDRRSLMFDLALAPAVVAGALLGRVLLRRMPQGLFDRLVIVLTVGAAALLLVH